MRQLLQRSMAISAKRARLRNQAAQELVGFDADIPRQCVAQLLCEAPLGRCSGGALRQRGTCAQHAQRGPTLALHQFTEGHVRIAPGVGGVVPLAASSARLVIRRRSTSIWAANCPNGSYAAARSGRRMSRQGR